MKYITIFLLLLSLLSCSDKITRIKLATDDPSVINAVNLFNSESETVKIDIELYDRSEFGLFNILKKEELNKYDLIAGYYYPTEILSDSKYAFVEHSIKFDELYPVSKSFYNISDGRGIVYSYDMTVLITPKSNENLYNFSSIEEFRETAVNTSVYPTDDNLLFNLSFIPDMSTIKKLEFIFFGADLYNSENDFNKSQLEKNYDLYVNFNKQLITDNIIEKISSKYDKIDKAFYLNNNILKYDIRYLSDALTLPDSHYKIGFIENSRTSLRQRLITVNKRSFVKKECSFIINKLLSRKYQVMMLDETIKSRETYENIFIPVRKNIISDYKDQIKILDAIDKYACVNVYPNFGNTKKHSDFIKAYTVTSDMIDKERLKKKELIDNIEKRIK